MVTFLIRKLIIKLQVQLLKNNNNYVSISKFIFNLRKNILSGKELKQ